MPLIELNNASARYNGHAVLHDISLQISRGERVALVGRSGAGKSTLLSLLYERHQSNAVIVPQELGLVQTLSVFHNIYMGRLHLHRTLYNLVNLIHPLKREIDGILPIVENLGLEEKLLTPVGELSGGQQQRTAVGRALHKGGAIFFGDEPVSAVDEYQARNMLRSVTDAYETAVLSMHDVGLAIEFTDRVIGVKDGRIVFDELTDEMQVSDLNGIYRK